MVAKKKAVVKETKKAAKEVPFNIKSYSLSVKDQKSLFDCATAISISTATKHLGVNFDLVTQEMFLIYMQLSEHSILQGVTLTLGTTETQVLLQVVSADPVRFTKDDYRLSTDVVQGYVEFRILQVIDPNLNQEK